MEFLLQRVRLKAPHQPTFELIVFENEGVEYFGLRYLWIGRRPQSRGLAAPVDVFIRWWKLGGARSKHRSIGMPRN